MNILIRAEGIIGPLPPPWYQVPNTEGTWVHELQATTTRELPAELYLIRDALEAADQASGLVLHFGKYDDLQALVLSPELLTLILHNDFSVEVH